MSYSRPPTGACPASEYGNSHRDKAFRKPAPATWIPAVGDWVYLPRIARTIGNIVCTAKVASVAGSCVLVKASYGSKALSEVYDISFLRPIPQPRKKVEVI